MPFLLMLLGAAVAGWFWFNRGRAGAEALLGAAEEVRLAARRFGFKGRANLHPVEAVEDSRVLMAMIAAGFIELDGAPLREQVAKVSASLAQNNRMTLDESDEMLVLARWLVGQCGGAEPAIARGVRRLYKLRGAQDLGGLMDLVQDGVLAGGGGLTARQKEALAEVQRGLRI